MGRQTETTASRTSTGHALFWPGAIAFAVTTGFFVKYPSAGLGLGSGLSAVLLGVGGACLIVGAVKLRAEKKPRRGRRGIVHFDANREGAALFYTGWF